MKLSLQWLKRYVDFDKTPEQVSETITRLGLEVESIETLGVAPNEKLVVLQGLENFIVVDTPDILLICERNREQQIKEYVAEVKRNKGDKFL